MEKRKQAYKKNIGFVQIPKEMLEKKAEISKHNVAKKQRKERKIGFLQSQGDAAATRPRGGAEMLHAASEVPAASFKSACGNNISHR